MSASEPEVVVVSGPGPRWLRSGLVVAAVIYLAALVAGPSKIWGSEPALPTLRLFTQVACLFPNAARMSIDYRVEAFDCDNRTITELDTGVYFPMHRSNKENRLHRVGFLFRNNDEVMQALDDFLVTQHNARLAAGLPAHDGVDGVIGGIRLQSLRTPLPPLGAPIERYQRKPLDEHPKHLRKTWYRTPGPLVRERCEIAPYLRPGAEL
jgi:hypothetical protein